MSVTGLRGKLNRSLGSRPAAVVPMNPDPMLSGPASAAESAYGPAVMAAMEAAQGQAFQAQQAAKGLAAQLGPMVQGISLRIGGGYNTAAGSVANTAARLGEGVKAGDYGLAGNIGSSLAAAGQDTGVADELRQIGQQSQGVLNALGAGAVQNLLSQGAAAQSLSAKLGQLQVSGFQKAASTVGTPDLSQAVQIAQQQADSTMQAYEQAQAAQAKAVSDQAAREWDQRKFVATMSYNMWVQGQENQRALISANAASGRAGLTQKNENIRAQLSQQGQNRRQRERERASAREHAADRAARASAARTKAAQARQKARASAMSHRDSALSSMEGQATTWAGEHARGRRVQRQVKEGAKLVTKTVTVPYSRTEAYKRLLAQLRSKYATDIRRYGVKPQRLGQVARDALAAAGYNVQTGPSKPAYGRGL